jgi:hypothetical protein
MCDCYGHACQHEGCINQISWHIGDFAFEREEFKIWCGDHYKEAPPNAILFKITEASRSERDEVRQNHIYCAVVGPECDDTGDNYPNLSSDFERVLQTKRRHAGKGG